MAIIYKIVTIQFVEGGEWKQIAETMGLRYKTVKATRGNIYSDNGSLLATSLPYYKVCIDPTVASEEVFENEIDGLATNLSKFFKGGTSSYYKRKIHKARNKGRRYLPLGRREINYQEKKEIASWPIFKYGKMRGGVIFEKVDKRVRPFSHLGNRTIGWLNNEEKGMVGVEYSFNHFLAGRDGKALFEKIAGGNLKSIHDESEIKPVNGYDVETTIDVNLQDVAETALLKALSEHEADYGSVIVMEVKTGEIKAISSLSKNSRDQYLERYNYAIASQGSREPGSTFKLASMMALLEATDIKLTDSVDTGNGRLKLYNEVLKDHKPGGYGMLSVKEVFEKSSNIGVAKLIIEEFGQKPHRYIDYLTKFGLTKPLGFQLIGEGKPFITTPSDSTWSSLTLPWMSHGYELKMTPLHTLAFYNAVANEGKMIQPILVRKILNAEEVVQEFYPRVINRSICSKNTLTKVKKMLEGVVERGTAMNISNKQYKIAGKTGTAKKLINGRYSNKYYTSFAGYFPANHPKYSCIVVIDDPKGYRIYGSDVAAPVFKEIADKIYSSDPELNRVKFEELQVVEGIYPVIRSGHAREINKICKELEVPHQETIEGFDWGKTRLVNGKVGWKSNTTRAGLIPDVVGMSLRDAIFVLENQGLNVLVKGKGRVISQSIPPGTKSDLNKEVAIELG